MTRYDFPSVAAVRIAAKRLSIEHVKLGGRTLYDPADWEEAKTPSRSFIPGIPA